MKQYTIRAKNLRNNQTDAEKYLWHKIRARQLSGYTFRRQHVIDIYIVDFVCIELKLIIEIYGSQHIDQKEYDDIRSQYLQSQGYKVIRFWNNEVLNHTNSVLTEIIRHLPSSPSPSSHFTMGGGEYP